MVFGALTFGRRERHGLASALIGEIAAAIEALEHYCSVRRSCSNDPEVSDPACDFSDFELPRLAVYEANVAKLSLFTGALPQELSYFYTRLGNLPQRLRELKPSGSSSAEELKARMHTAIDEIDQTMTLGEDLLRSMKAFVSRRQPTSISRA
jgi:hypothetical protein